MKPTLYIISLIVGTVGIASLQFALPDALAIVFLWASVVISAFSAGRNPSKKEQLMAVMIASIVAIYLTLDESASNDGADRLYLFRPPWFIVPVWFLLLFHSAFRIHRHYENQANQRGHN